MFYSDYGYVEPRRCNTTLKCSDTKYTEYSNGWMIRTVDFKHVVWC